MAERLAEPSRFCRSVGRSTEGAALGLIEASVRNDCMNGTYSKPVAFHEGLCLSLERGAAVS